MTTRLKFLVCLVWAIALVAFFSSQLPSSANDNTDKAVIDVKTALKPEKTQIERFNEALQNRFLTQPYFGIRRLDPPYKPNPHFENSHFIQFIPQTNEEKASVEDFERNGWKVSLYLFGRRATPIDAAEKDLKEFKIDYRLNSPLLVTKNLKITQVASAAKLQNEVKMAFDNFQNSNSSNNESYEFSVGKWSYVAKPVRAVDESCIKCHTDYVAIPQSGKNEYQFRRRQVGDANGVLVYGFARDK
jgi:hypothetical protein